MPRPPTLSKLRKSQSAVSCASRKACAPSVPASSQPVIRTTTPGRGERGCGEPARRARARRRSRRRCRWRPGRRRRGARAPAAARVRPRRSGPRSGRGRTAARGPAEQGLGERRAARTSALLSAIQRPSSPTTRGWKISPLRELSMCAIRQSVRSARRRARSWRPRSGSAAREQRPRAACARASPRLASAARGEQRQRRAGPAAAGRQGRGRRSRRQDRGRRAGRSSSRRGTAPCSPRRRLARMPLGHELRREPLGAMRGRRGADVAGEELDPLHRVLVAVARGVGSRPSSTAQSYARRCRAILPRTCPRPAYAAHSASSRLALSVGVVLADSLDRHPGAARHPARLRRDRRRRLLGADRLQPRSRPGDPPRCAARPRCDPRAGWAVGLAVFALASAACAAAGSRRR